jgi:hypothetical protein
MLFFNTLLLILFGIIIVNFFALGVTAIVLNITFRNAFPRIRKSIYLDDIHSVNKLIEALNE